jgi:hypothetical protein
MLFRLRVALKGFAFGYVAGFNGRVPRAFWKQLWQIIATSGSGQTLPCRLRSIERWPGPVLPNEQTSFHTQISLRFGCTARLDGLRTLIQAGCGPDR